MPRRAQMSGMFDWLRKLLPPSMPGQEPSMLPAVRKEQLPAQIKKPSSVVDVFKGTSKGLIKAPESVIEVFKPKAKGLIEAPKGVHDVFAPPQKSLLPEEAKQEQVKWEELVPKEIVQGVPLSEELTKFLKPATVFEASRFVQPDEWPFGEPPIWSDTPWKMPTTYEVADYIRQRWDLPAMYDYVLSHVETPWWKRQVSESAHVGEPAVLDVEQMTSSQDQRLDLPRFLRIPDAVIELYGRYGPEGINRFNVEVLQPMLDRVEKALEVFRPTPVLRGWFEVEPDEQMNFWVRYKEARFPQEQ